MSKLTTAKKQEIAKKVISALKPYRLSDVEKEIDLKTAHYNLAENQLKRLKKYIISKLYEIRIKSLSRHAELAIYAPYPSLDPLELINVFGRNSYASYFTALYINELTDQVPKTYHVTIPRSNRNRLSVKSYSELDFYSVRDTFMKKPRKTNYILRYENNRYVLLERDVIYSLGVRNKKFLSEQKEVEIRVTDLEQTLLDCAIAPYHSGGINSVLTAFNLASEDLNLGRLFSYYKAEGYIYPYWQRVGFLIENAIGVEQAKIWDGLFTDEKKPFFLMHQYQASWLCDRNWKIYYPPSFNFLA